VSGLKKWCLARRINGKQFATVGRRAPFTVPGAAATICSGCSALQRVDLRCAG
jgi:hypothetical protein